MSFCPIKPIPLILEPTTFRVLWAGPGMGERISGEAYALYRLLGFGQRTDAPEAIQPGRIEHVPGDSVSTAHFAVDDVKELYWKLIPSHYNPNDKGAVTTDSLMGRLEDGRFFFAIARSRMISEYTDIYDPFAEITVASTLETLWSLGIDDEDKRMVEESLSGDEA